MKDNKNINIRAHKKHEPKNPKLVWAWDHQKILNTRHPKKENLRPKTISDFKETTSFMNTAPSL